MPEYLTLVRGGRPPSDELIREMTANYTAIGGRSPLTRLTEAQAEALRQELGLGVPVYVGMPDPMCAAMFSRGSLSSISFATVTPSFVIVGPPNFFSRTTLRPLGPESDFDCLGELVNAAQDRLPRMFAINNLLCHRSCP